MSTTSTTRSALRTRRLAGLAVLVAVGIGLTAPPSASGQADNEVTTATSTATASRVTADQVSTAAAAGAPNIFFYNLDDLRDAFPGGIDPLRFMPKTRAWMATGRRYTQMFVADPSCCPSRAALMTGRYPHNNGVQDQQDGPLFDGPHSMACYLRTAGYATYLDGKFLTTWPKTTLPPCFDHSTVMWGGYRNVSVRVDGGANRIRLLDDLPRQPGPAVHHQRAVGTKPFLLYETPQAPHWVDISNPDGTASKLAVPDTQYATADVGTCSGVPESDRSDKPAYVRTRTTRPHRGRRCARASCGRS